MPAACSGAGEGDPGDPCPLPPIPPMSPVAISLLMLAAFAGFGYLAWRKLAIVAALAPEGRFDHPGQRLMAVLTNGLLQQRMIRRDWKPGIMHAVIFLGFMALLVRKVQLIVIGYHEPFMYPGLAGGVFAAAKDVVELAAAGGAGLCVLAALRDEARPARTQPGSLAGPVADHRDRDHGPRVRWLPLRPVRRQRPRHRARARLGLCRPRRGARGVGPGSRHAHGGLPRLLLDPAGRRLHLPGDPADRRAFPHRHRAAGAVLPARQARQRGAVRRSREAHGRGQRRRYDARGRADGEGPHVEGWAGRLHLHRVRPLQGRMPDLPHRQAAVAEVGSRQPQAPPAREARRHHGERGRPGRAAGPRSRRDRRGHAVGLHDLRLLRGRVPDRARAPAEVLPDAPAARADGRRFPARAEARVRGLRGAEQSVGIPLRHPRRLGAGSRCDSRRVRGRHKGPRLPVLRRLRRILRPARPEDRAGLRRDPAAGGCAVRHSGPCRNVDRRMRAPRRQRDAVPATGERRSWRS